MSGFETTVGEIIIINIGQNSDRLISYLCFYRLEISSYDALYSYCSGARNPANQVYLWSDDELDLSHVISKVQLYPSIKPYLVRKAMFAISNRRFCR